MFLMIGIVVIAACTFVVFCAVMANGATTSPSLRSTLEDLEQMRELRRSGTATSRGSADPSMLAVVGDPREDPWPSS